MRSMFRVDKWRQNQRHMYLMGVSRQVYGCRVFTDLSRPHSVACFVILASTLALNRGQTCCVESVSGETKEDVMARHRVGIVCSTHCGRLSMRR
jgi:hypothetical protein